MREYIQDNFYSEDRLAVLCKAERVLQRIVSAEELIESRFQSWLKEQNDHGANIYVSMNALRAEARQRTKQDIAAIRHIYLDVDYDGQAALSRITANAPVPSYILNTSPGKYQVVWKVDGFSATSAEALQRSMALQYGTDRAATDITRVLRIPGFTNRKYDPPFLVTAQKISNRLYQPSDFRIVERLHEQSSSVAINPAPRTSSRNDSQSERDWREVCRRIERGDNPADVRNWLESSRPDKSNPRYYAELTIGRALSHCVVQIPVGKSTGGNSFEKPKHEGDKSMEKHFIAGNTLPVKDELKKLGCQYDAETKQWFHSDKAVVEKAQTLVPSELEKHRIGYAPKELSETLREMGAKWDDKGWYHADKEIAEKLQQLLPTVHRIGYAPKELSETLREIGARYDDKGWFHTSEAVAHSAHALILSKEPRYYLDGDAISVKDKLKEMGCHWDEHKKQWYHTDKEIAAKAQEIVPEKHRIGFAPKELTSALKEMGAKWDEKGWYHTDPAVAEKAKQMVREAAPRHYLDGDAHPVKEQLKEMGCRWDSDAKQWYHSDAAVAEKAQALITNGVERHYIPNVPFKLNQKVMEMGCRWDSDTKQWYHTNPEIAKQAAQLAEQTPHKGNDFAHAVRSAAKEVAHEI